MKGLLKLLFAVIIITASLSCSRTEKGTAGGNGDAAPAFILSTLKNEKVSLKDYRGKVVLVEFFASWCPPCQMAAPNITSVYEKYKDRGFVALGVSIDEGQNAAQAVRNFIKDYGITYPVLLDDGSAGRQYQVISIPTSFIIDRQGKLRNKHIGLGPDFADALSKEIEPLL